MARTPAVITVDFSEEVGSPRWGYDRISGQWKAERDLFCDWDDAPTLLAELLGTVRVGGEVSEPHRFPLMTSLLARSAQITGFGQGTDDPSLATTGLRYPRARVSVVYEAGGFGGPFGDPTVAEETIEPAVRFLTLGGRQYFWDDAGTDPVDTNDELPGFMVRSFDYVVRIPAIAVLPVEVLTLTGSCNAAEVRLSRLGSQFVLDPETLLYQPPVTKRIVTASGAGAWSAEFRFAYQPGGWNQFYRSANVRPAGHPNEGQLYPSPIYWNPESGGAPAAFEPVKFYPPASFDPIMNLIR